MRVTKRTRKSRLELETPDDDTLLKYAEQALDRPANAYFHDGDLYATHTLMSYSAPQSDDLIAQSNHATILRDLSDAYPHAVEAASIGHWTYSHFDCVKVRVLDRHGRIHPAFADAVAITLALRDYPLWDEDDYYQRESAEWDRAIDDAVNVALSGEDDADAIREDVVAYLYSDSAQLMGYHDVGYVPSDTLDAAITHARALKSAADAVGVRSDATPESPLF